MTSLPISYTPLESLLLFQALRVEGVASPSFTRISDQLQSIPLVRSHPTYDAARLDPSALRQLYLDLLKDEVAQDLQHHHDKNKPPVNGDSSPVSRKRKAPSPTLPTLHDAVQHAHLLPQLVARLYARYRDITVKEIRECERKHDTLCHDEGEGDDHWRKQQLVDTTQSSQPSSLVHRQDHARPTIPQVATHDPLQISDPKVPSTKYSAATIDAVINHGPEPQHSASVHHERTSSNTTLPPISDIAPPSPRSAYPGATASIVTQMPHLAQSTSVSYTHSPPAAQHSPYVSHHGHALPMQNPLSRPSSSPRPVLPPPPGMSLPSHSPVHHTGSPIMHGLLVPVQQPFQPPHRGSARPSPVMDREPRAFHPPSIGYQHHQPGFPDRRPSHPAQQGMLPGSYPPQLQPTQSGGHQLPPFYLDPAQAGTFSQKQPLVTQQQHTPRQMPPHMYAQATYGPPQYPPAPATGPRPKPHTRLISDIVAALATPPRVSLQRPLWKSERRPRPLAIPAAPARPEVEPLSPTLTRKSPARSSRSTRNNRIEKADDHEPEPAPAPEPRKGRRRRARNKSPHSIMSSAAGLSTRGRTRSESVSTAVSDRMDLDERPRSGSRVKNEPSTPAETPDEVETALEHSITSSGRMTRQRRGTLQSQPHLVGKRKRRPSTATADGEAEHLGTPPPRPTTVTAHRGFDKTSSTLVENIGSHKHAVFFQGAVRNKDAQGYSEIIKQPQHLKGIKSAILAGRRAVAASSETGNIVELERSVDLMPPKAIVNGTQLEKEVMRTMANAAMFNPGEDGLVSDTREMFEDVEAMFAEWRGAEQETGGPGEEEEIKGKRRKL